jgi:hypothetical protein
MKHQTIASLLLLVGALHGAGQGTVRFENNIPGALVTHVNGHKVNVIASLQGNGPDDFPAGAFNWSGWPLVAGSGFSAQLLAAPGANVPFMSLTPASPVTTFQTGDNAGFVVPLIPALEGVPVDAPVATVAMVAWDNRNGTLNNWLEARWYSPGLVGWSLPFNVYDIGGGANPAPVLSGLQSFSMEEQYAVPEPYAASLLVLGLATAAVLARRRETRAR